MNDDKRKKKTDILTNEAYELLFGHLNEEKKQKKKKKKILPKREEKGKIPNSKPEHINNIQPMIKQEIRSTGQKNIENVDKFKENKAYNDYQKEKEFIGKKRININHKIDLKDNKDRNKEIKTKEEKFVEHNYDKQSKNNNNDIKIKNNSNYSPNRNYSMGKQSIYYRSDNKEKKIIKSINNNLSTEKKYLKENNKISNMNVKKEYSSKSELSKKIIKSSDNTLNNNINHSNNMNNIRKEDYYRNNQIKEKVKEINHSYQQQNKKMINNSTNKNEIKDNINSHKKIINHRENNKENIIKLKANINTDKIKDIKRKDEKNIPKIQEKRKEDLKQKPNNHNNHNILINNKSNNLIKNNISKSIISEKPYKTMSSSNSNKNIQSKAKNSTSNINLHITDSERNKFNINQKLKSKQPIISQNNSGKINKSNENIIKRPENTKHQSHQIYKNSSQNKININKNIHNDSHNMVKNKNKVDNIHNTGDSKIDRIKNSLESRRIGPEMKLTQQEKMRYDDGNKKPTKKYLNRQFFEQNEYDDNDDFIDDSNYRKNKEVMKVLKNFKTFQDMRKKNEVEGDIEVANYDIIQAEEARTRRIGMQEDQEALEEIRKRGYDEEDEEDEDEY